jgi:hypothetical protein
VLPEPRGSRSGVYRIGNTEWGKTMRKIALLVALAALAGCGTSGPEHVQSTGPTVTYRFYGEPRGDELEQATDHAQEYCSDRYGQAARLQDVTRDGEANIATFECA